MIFAWTADTPEHEAIFQALGAASMCWEPNPEGVFDSEQAKEIGEELIDFLHAKRLVS